MFDVYLALKIRSQDSRYGEKGPHQCVEIYVRNKVDEVK